MIIFPEGDSRNEEQKRGETTQRFKHERNVNVKRVSKDKSVEKFMYLSVAFTKNSPFYHQGG